jgi:hypothetical protein
VSERLRLRNIADFRHHCGWQRRSANRLKAFNLIYAMEFTVTWNILASILLLAGVPFLLQKGKTSIFFDSRNGLLSKVFHIFVAVTNTCVYICSIQNRAVSNVHDSNNINNLLLELCIPLAAYFLLSILFLDRYNDEIVQRKNEEFNYYQLVKLSDDKLIKKNAEKIKKLKNYFGWLKVLLILSITSYFLFFFFLAKVLIRYQVY